MSEVILIKLIFIIKRNVQHQLECYFKNKILKYFKNLTLYFQYTNVLPKTKNQNYFQIKVQLILYILRLSCYATIIFYDFLDRQQSFCTLFDLEIHS